MRWEIQPVLDRSGGVTSRAHLLRIVTRGELDDEIRRGRLVAVLPRAYARPWDADLDSIRERAAFWSVGRPVVLSHLTALRKSGIEITGTPPHEVHVLVPYRRAPRQQPGRLRVHRSVAAFPPPLVSYGGMPAVRPAQALVQSWPLLDRRDRRTLVLDAVRRRRMSVEGLERALATPGTRGRRELADVVALLRAGCESELEIHGLLHVFDVPGLRHGRRQLPVRVGGRSYRLDLAYLDEKVAVELDGGTHSGRDARESDTRRDAALAAAGWLTVRFTYRRLMDDPGGCRRELLSILATRRGIVR